MRGIAWRGGAIVLFIVGLQCREGSGGGEAAVVFAPDIAVVDQAVPDDAGGFADEAAGGNLPEDDAREAAFPDTLDEAPADAKADAGTPETGIECLPPAQWWDDFALPEDPKDGIEPGPPVVKVCMEPMPEAYFDGIPCPIWGPENPLPPGKPPIEPVHVWYDADKRRLIFDYAAPEGFALRSDGVGVNWYGDSTNGFVVRLEFSLTWARFLEFERGTGKFHGESVLVPLTGAICVSGQ